MNEDTFKWKIRTQLIARPGQANPIHFNPSQVRLSSFLIEYETSNLNSFSPLFDTFDSLGVGGNYHGLSLRSRLKLIQASVSSKAVLLLLIKNTDDQIRQQKAGELERAWSWLKLFIWMDTCCFWRGEEDNARAAARNSFLIARQRKWKKRKRSLKIYLFRFVRSQTVR